jgi:hypothetical protein
MSKIDELRKAKFEIIIAMIGDDPKLYDMLKIYFEERKT